MNGKQQMQNDKDSEYSLEESRQILAKSRKILQMAKTRKQAAAENGAAADEDAAEKEKEPKKKAGRPKKKEETNTVSYMYTHGLCMSDTPQPSPPPHSPPESPHWKAHISNGLGIASSNLQWVAGCIWAFICQVTSWLWRHFFKPRCSQILGWLFTLAVPTTALLVIYLTYVKPPSRPAAITYDKTPFIPVVSGVQLQNLGIEWTSSEHGQQSSLQMSRIGQTISSTALSLSSRLTPFTSRAFQNYASSHSAPLDLPAAITAFADALHTEILDAQVLAQLLATTFNDVAALLHYTGTTLRPTRGAGSKDDPRVMEAYTAYLDQLAPRFVYLLEAIVRLREDDKEATTKGKRLQRLVGQAEQAMSSRLPRAQVQTGLYDRVFGGNRDAEIEVPDDLTMLRFTLGAVHAQQQSLDEAEDLAARLPELGKTVEGLLNWVLDVKIREGKRDVWEHAETLDRKFGTGRRQAGEVSWGEMITGRLD